MNMNDIHKNFDKQKIINEFPALKQKVWDKSLVYLDSAASMQKPKDVIDVINNNYSKEYSNVHRGLHFLSEKATESYEEARRKVAKFINADEKEIIFTSGATASINLVAYSWGMENLSTNDEIILTIAEHHANFVPCQYIAGIKKAKIKVAYFDPDKDFDINIIKSIISDKTKVITLKKKPKEFLEVDCFSIEERPIRELLEGEVLLKTIYLLIISKHLRFRNYLLVTLT